LSKSGQNSIDQPPSLSLPRPLLAQSLGGLSCQVMVEMRTNNDDDDIFIFIYFSNISQYGQHRFDKMLTNI